MAATGHQQRQDDEDGPRASASTCSFAGCRASPRGTACYIGCREAAPGRLGCRVFLLRRHSAGQRPSGEVPARVEAAGLRPKASAVPRRTGHRRSGPPTTGNRPVAEFPGRAPAQSATIRQMATAVVVADVRGVPAGGLDGRPQGQAWRSGRPDGRGAQHARLDRDADDDRHVGRRRLPARHGGRRLPLQRGVWPAGRRVLRHQPDPRRPLLCQDDAPPRVHDACRSVRDAVRQPLGGGPVRCQRCSRRSSGAPSCWSRSAPPSARFSTWTCGRRSSLCVRRDGVHGDRGHVVRGLHRCDSVGVGRSGTRRGALVVSQPVRLARRGVGGVRGRTAAGRQPDASTAGRHRRSGRCRAPSTGGT